MNEDAKQGVRIRRAELCDEDAIEVLVSTYFHDIEGLLVEDFFVAEIGGRIVGAACMEMNKLPEVHSIVVHPKHRGKGIGSLLIDALVSEMDDDFLFTRTTLPVFFEKTGFIRLDDSEKAEIWDDCADCSRLNDCRQSVLRLDIKDKRR